MPEPPFVPPAPALIPLDDLALALGWHPVYPAPLAPPAAWQAPDGSRAPTLPSAADLLAEVRRLRAENAAWQEIREPAFLWAECQHALQYGEMFPDEQDESYSDAYDAEDEIEGALYDAIIAHIPADWNPTAEQAPWRAEYHSQKDVP